MNKNRLFHNVRVLGLFVALMSLVATGHVQAEEPSSEVSDTWLQAKLVTIYTLNRNLSVFDIDTDVKDQVVALTGTVESDIQKDLAGEIAKSIEGVKGVENRLAVKLDSQKQAARQKIGETEKSLGETIDDLTTTASVKTALLTNANVDGLKIAVSTDRGTVMLKGEVSSDAEKELAEKLAGNVSGVRDVTNEIKITG